MRIQQVQLMAGAAVGQAPPSSMQVRHTRCSAKEMQFTTQQIDAWLEASGALPLVRDGFASCALLTDFAQVCRINQEMRSLPEAWPDDHWIIGEDGAGGYFVVSKSDKYRGVQFFDHEWKLFEEFQPTLRKFFDYCIEIERRNQAEQGRGANALPRAAHD